jgi:hypothetical protein
VVFLQVVNRATGANLFAALEASFIRDGIPFSNLIGFGSDNAANMVGKHNSVWSRVEDKQPNCYLTGCVCHIAATCSSDACQKIPENVEKMVSDIFSYFYKSPVRLVAQFDLLVGYCIRVNIYCDSKAEQCSYSYILFVLLISSF